MTIAKILPQAAKGMIMAYTRRCRDEGNNMTTTRRDLPRAGLVAAGAAATPSLARAEPHDHDQEPDTLASLPRLPRDDNGPVFAEPWQAHAFALAVTLSELGHFTWTEWAAVLSNELKADAARGEPDDGSRYYHCWLAALEHLVVQKQLSDQATLLERKEAWADAYRHTPHGMPVELKGEV